MDQSVTVFRDLYRTCDSVYRELHKQGIGASVRHTAIFSAEEETKLWKAGVLAIGNPKALHSLTWTIPTQFWTSFPVYCYHFVVILNKLWAASLKIRATVV